MGGFLLIYLTIVLLMPSIFMQIKRYIMADKKQITDEEINITAQNALKSKKIRICRVSFCYDANSSCQDALEIDKKTETLLLLVKTRQIYFNRRYYTMNKETYALARPLLARINRKQKWQKFWNKHSGVASSFLLGGTALAVLLAIANLSENNRKETKTADAKYEKTLSKYLEQKQKVENYRDSLRRAK